MNDLKKIERKEPLFVTIGRIRGLARSRADARLMALISKVCQDLDRLQVQDTRIYE